MAEIETVGFIGLGAMGGGMAANIVRAGYRTVVCDRLPERVQRLVELGAEPAGSPAEVGRSADVILTSLPGNEELLQVALGADGLIEGVRPGAVLVDTSTVQPQVVRRVGDALAKRGAAMLDAPVARGTQAAADGTLTIMVGGDEAVYQRCLPLLRRIGREIFYCGPLGSGAVLKLLNNLILFCNVTVLAEALTLGAKVGIAPETMIEVLGAGSANSFALQNHIRNSVLTRHFPTGKFPVNYALKDIEYALAMAKAEDVPMLHGAIAQQLLHTVRGLGFGEHYYPVVIEVLERMAGVQVAAPRRDSGDSKGGP